MVPNGHALNEMYLLKEGDRRWKVHKIFIIQLKKEK
jgi:hypothetical protein